MPEQLRTLGELGSYITRDTGQTLFSQGDTADAFYVLLHGKLEVSSLGGGHRRCFRPTQLSCL